MKFFPGILLLHPLLVCKHCFSSIKQLRQAWAGELDHPTYTCMHASLYHLIANYITQSADVCIFPGIPKLSSHRQTSSLPPVRSERRLGVDVYYPVLHCATKLMQCEFTSDAVQMCNKHSVNSQASDTIQSMRYCMSDIPVCYLSNLV